MKDFYYEQTRLSVNEDWGDEISVSMLADKFNVPRVSYRIYYAKDNLTRRIFIFRGNCTLFEMETLIGLGFVSANDGDTENIPDQLIEGDDMPWIENVAAADIPTGFHHDAGPNSMLISIVDPASWRPEAKHQFKERHNFEFLDIEEKDFALDEAMRCSHEQAAELVRLLQHALENRMNVVVHCYAGICRSGAVCEVGVMMGFDDTKRFRAPNLLVKHRMMKHLGWTYDADEKPNIDDWRTMRPIGD